MDLLNQNKFLKWLVIILALLNLGTLSVMWIGKPAATLPPPPPSHGARDNMVGFLRNELKLNDEQVEEFSKLRDKHFLSAKKISREMHELKKSLMDNVFKNEPINKDSIATLIGKKQTQLELLTYNHFMELKEVCGKEQIHKLKKMLGGFFKDRELPPKSLRKRPPPPNRN